ncbi:MAG: alpha/beta hydrolase [Elusimicrobiaceae bacterium]|nr:alpha/beta hydrolase [Elusimicrobiaceae bacterium]
MTNIILIVLFSLLFLILLTVGICIHVAKWILHPRSKRKPLDVWPDQDKLPYDKISFLTEDGIRLRGWFIPKQDSHKTIIFMHGWGMNRGDIYKNTHFLHDLGYNLMYFDFRALGESGGTVSSIGYLEIQDLQAAIKFLKKTYPQASEKIGIYGLSMGGMVAICEGAQNPDVSCVVAEASYYSFRRVVTRWAWVHNRVPYLPLIPIVLHYIRQELNANPEHFSPRYNVSKISPKPLFIIHGACDKLVPISQAKKLYRKAGHPKQIWLVPNASHPKCAVEGGFEYKQKLAEFFQKYL